MSISTDPLAELNAKLARLAANSKYSNKSAEGYSTPFPLYALLTLYTKATRDCYIDYMLGFKLLNIWLSPIVTHNQDVPDYGDILNNYEINEMSAILNIPQDVIIHTLIDNVKLESIPK